MDEQEVRPNHVASKEPTEGTNLPKSASVLDGIDCDAPLVPVLVSVELPFWLMVPDGEVEVTVEGAKFTVRIDESYVDLFAREASDSRITSCYNGPIPPKDALVGQAAMSGASLMFRKAKTVLTISSKCSSDALSAVADKPQRKRTANYYFVSFCSAHLPVVNHLINAYRWSTADFMVVAVTPRSVPVWRVRSGKGGCINVHLLPEATWDYKPRIEVLNDPDNKSVLQQSPFEFTSIETLATAVSENIEPSELALLDARSFFHQGDYSGAIRRAVTALEVLLERQLRAELSKCYEVSDVEKRLCKSRLNFSKRLGEYEKLSARTLNDKLRQELKDIRELRHEIVHRGRLVTYGERGIAKKAVDMGRFIYNWLENDPTSVQRREKLMAQKALGGIDLGFFYADISPDGVRVKRPVFDPRRTSEV